MEGHRAGRLRFIPFLGDEIRAHIWEWTPETVYLGGGTPSQLDPAALGALLDLVPGRPWAEATIEAAPGDITAEKARAWVAAGMDGVSRGAQACVERDLRGTGRKHTGQTVADDVATLRAAGI